MTTTQNFVIGNRTKIYFGILPDSMLDAPAEPADVTITVDVVGTGGQVAIGATTIPTAPLSNPVPRGTPLPFIVGNVTVWAYTTASAITGAIALSVEPLRAAIPDGSQALYTGMLLLAGGTTSSEQIQAKDTETTVYGDDLGYSTGVVTGASWSISYSFNVLPSDAGYFRLAYAATHAVTGVRCWIRKEDPAPNGYTKGETIAGVCDVTDFSKDNPADNILSGKCTFKGRGTPVLKHYE